jgi:hypothetical protein
MRVVYLLVATDRMESLNPRFRANWYAHRFAVFTRLPQPQALSLRTFDVQWANALKTSPDQLMAQANEQLTTGRTLLTKMTTTPGLPLHEVNMMKSFIKLCVTNVMTATTTLKKYMTPSTVLPVPSSTTVKAKLVCTWDSGVALPLFSLVPVPVAP